MQAEKRHFHRLPRAPTGRMQGKIAMGVKKNKAPTLKEINAANKAFWDSGYKALDSNGLPNLKDAESYNPRSAMTINQFVDEAINELGQLAKNPLIAEGDLAQDRLKKLHKALSNLQNDCNDLYAFVDAMKVIGWLYCKAGIDLEVIKNQGRSEAEFKRKSENSKGGKNKNEALKAYLESIIPDYAGQHIDAVLNNIYMAVKSYAKDNGLPPLSSTIKKKKTSFTYGMETLKGWIKSSSNNQIKFD